MLSTDPDTIMTNIYVITEMPQVLVEGFLSLRNRNKSETHHKLGSWFLSHSSNPPQLSLPLPIPLLHSSSHPLKCR
jgi:hypothetical protein